MRQRSRPRLAHPPGLDADRIEGLRLMDVSRETERRLNIFVDLLKRWQGVKNLVGSATLPQVWTRHIADSAQLARIVPEAARWIDMGSGAGFPGLVIAILLQERPERPSTVHLVESNSRKCAFLREVVREVGCSAEIHDARAEAIVGTLGEVDVVTSRALAPLRDLLEMGKIPMRMGASGLFLKTAAEIDALPPGFLSDTWTIIPSLTSPDGRVVLIRPDPLSSPVLGGQAGK